MTDVNKQTPPTPQSRVVGKPMSQVPRQTKQNTIPPVMDRISPIGFDPEDGIHLLLYGRSGTGKTSLCATFPKPILFIICSGGDKPGELRSIDTPEYRKSIKQLVLEKSSELHDLVSTLRSRWDSYRFSTLVLDHATGLQDLVLKEILGLDEVLVERSWGLVTQQEYGQCTLQCKELFRDLLSLPCNVVTVAQEREFNTESTSSVIMPYVGAGLTPSLTGWLNSASDYICQTFIRQKEEVKRLKVGDKMVDQRVKTKQVEYCLRTAPDPVFMTRFRVPRGTPLPECIVDPSYEKLIDIIRGVPGTS